MSREMKNSGIEWIGQIPQHWIALPNKYLMKKLKMILSRYNDEPILSLTMDGVIVRDLDAGGKMPTSFDGYQKISKGNLLMCLFDIDVTPRCIGLIKQDGVTSPAYSQFVLNAGNYAPYYYYLYLYLDNDKLLLPLAKNLRHSLTEDVLGEIPMIQPPLSEQQSIANYLNHKTSQIDALVSDIEAQIAKLDEYKKALITQAVTKGLDPNAEMKDSGVEWISTIPEKWNIAPLKSIFSFGKGLSITKDDLIESGSPVISYGQIHAKDATGTSIKDRHIRYVSEDYLSTSPSSLAKQGDIIVADTSEDLEGAGNATFVDRPTIFAGYHTILLKNNGKADGKYISYLMKTDQWRKQIRTAIWAVKVYSISQTVLRRTSVLLPPLSEQQQIANYLDQKTTQIDDLKQALKLKLDALANYKKTLIFDYVTGKKEVPADFKKEDAHE